MLNPHVKFPAIMALAAVLLLGVGCRRDADMELVNKYRAARKAYDESRTHDDFLKVAAMYQEIIDEGGHSGILFYHQGNALMQADCTGRAIAAYRLAKRYRPNDPYVENNLCYATGEDSSDDRKPILNHILFWQDWISYPTKFRMAAAATAATFMFSLMAMFVGRKLFGRLAFACLVLAAVLVFSVCYDWYSNQYIVRGVIIKDYVVARKGNAASYEPAFTEPLDECTEFRMLKHRNNWFLIRLPGGQEGWIEDDAAVLY